MRKNAFSFKTVLRENEEFPSVSELRIFFEQVLKEKDCEWNVKSLSYSPFETFHEFLKSQNLQTPVLLETLIQNSALRNKDHFESAYTKFKDRYRHLEVNTLMYLMDERFLNSRKEYDVCYAELRHEDKVKILLTAILWSECVFPCRGGATWKELFIKFSPDTLSENLPWLSSVKWTSCLGGGTIMEEEEEMKERNFEIIDRLWEWFDDDEQGPSVKLVFDMALRGMKIGVSRKGIAPIIDDIKKVILDNERMGG
ncbi:uncharacterized protein N7483_005985 [Penicillium malachiteum]|uniref:uncharacterized protein n=1 Tax=Penicillium malachiteum TaxID=1324776 RepID=UPI00254935CC|nr:uncharacterized protein N7483_005985 [Penicillium malachiteum]KAJ5731477.1 hypothetical protein N7483_005985 [Penicillium malachiteum]